MDSIAKEPRKKLFDSLKSCGDNDMQRGALLERLRAICSDRQNGLLMRPGGLYRNMAAMLAAVGLSYRPSGHG